MRHSSKEREHRLFARDVPKTFSPKPKTNVRVAATKRMTAIVAFLQHLKLRKGNKTSTGWDTCPALLALLLCSSTKKTSGTEIRRTPDVKLRFVGFRWFVSFNFGQVQLLRFFVVMVRSNSFGHLHSVMLTTLTDK